MKSKAKAVVIGGGAVEALIIWQKRVGPRLF